jgi:hypothetical protein
MIDEKERRFSGRRIDVNLRRRRRYHREAISPEGYHLPKADITSFAEAWHRGRHPLRYFGKRKETLE